MATDEELGFDVCMFVGGTGAPDIDPYFSVISGAEAVAQTVALRCLTPRAPAPGHLIGSEDDGIFLPDFVQGKFNRRTTFIVQQLVRAQARKDERVASTKVDVSVDAATQLMRVEIAGTTSDDEPFDLTLSVSDVTVALLDES